VTNRHIFNQYVIRVHDRNELQESLRKKGVGTEVYYPVPMHLQDCFAYLGHAAGAFPESERAAAETLAIPVHPELTEEQARYVVQCIREFYDERRSAASTVGQGAMPVGRSEAQNKGFVKA
jgi:dTDP-4-amino-4,6-dideoxygalactose transaminase